MEPSNVEVYGRLHLQPEVGADNGLHVDPREPQIVPTEPIITSLLPLETEWGREMCPELQIPDSQTTPTEPVKASLLPLETEWKREMRSQFQIPDRYTSVAAVIIRWHEALDMDLKCSDEVTASQTLCSERD